MSYVRENLLAGERVLYIARLHWIIFFGPFIFVGMGLLYFAMAIAYAEARSVTGTATFLSWSVAGIWALLVFLNWRTAEFALTDRRVVAKVGIISRHSKEILLGKVEALDVSQGILGRLLDFGTVIVRGTGGTGTRFPKIADPLAFRKRVQMQLERLANQATAAR
ncbi:MAG: PH domain-containing protein [Candidatus Methylomirabilales bacterium]